MPLQVTLQEPVLAQVAKDRATRACTSRNCSPKGRIHLACLLQQSQVEEALFCTYPSRAHSKALHNQSSNAIPCHHRSPSMGS